MYILQETYITFPVLKLNTTSSKTSSSSTIEWKNLDPTLQNSKRFVVFKNTIVKLILPSPNSIFICSNCKGIRLITRLRVGMSYLPKHKFKYNFRGCSNPIFSSSLDIKST